MAAVTRRAWLTAVSIAPLMGLRVTHGAGTKTRLTGRDRIRMHHLPNIALTTHTGRQVRFYDDLMKDKKVILNFMYVKCEGI